MTPTTILAALMIWPFVGLIVGLVIGRAIPGGDRRQQPGQGSADAGRGGVDQVSHGQRSGTNMDQHHA